MLSTLSSAGAAGLGSIPWATIALLVVQLASGSASFVF